MEIRPLPQCKSDLNFNPRQPWPSLMPVLSYQGQRLCGFDRMDENASAIEVSGPLEDLLFQIHPQLSFVEITRLFNALTKLGLEFDSSYLLQLWGYKKTEQLMNAMDKVLKLPQLFQEFAVVKDLSPRDLEPLNLNQCMEDELIEIASSRASKAEAVQLIELVADLKMLDRFPVDLNWNQKVSNLLEDLREVRFPRRIAKQKQARQKAKKLSWPRGARWDWKVSTDHNVLDLHLSVKSFQELEAVAHQLAHVTEQASLQENNPWH